MIAVADKVWVFRVDRKAGRKLGTRQQTNYEIKMYLSATEVETQRKPSVQDGEIWLKKWRLWLPDSSVYSHCLNSLNFAQILRWINIIPQLNLKPIIIISAMTVIITKYPQQL